MTIQDNSLEQLENNSSEEKLPALYRHRKRPEWGVALIAWDRPTKRAYQFEDGNLRVIKRGFYGFLDEVDVPRGKMVPLVNRLRRLAGHSTARRAAITQAKQSGTEVVSLKRQLAAFVAKYPQQFGGSVWKEKHRGLEQKRRLKRHRAPAMAAAKEQWSQQALADLAGQTVIERWHAVLQATDLVTAKQLRVLETISPFLATRVAEAFFELLYGTGPIAQRIDHLGSLLPDASWELITTPLMLLYPEQHISVRASTFKKQAAWMMPRMSHEKRPSGRTYQRYREMAQQIKRQLEQAGSSPRDLCDVYDFIRISLLPSTLKLAR